MSVLWIVGLTNALNLIDGLDGLATGGVASIASISFMVISFLFGPPSVVILAAILAGSCLGFLPHNFNPATIFMGDTGSTFLGFTLAVISIQGLTKSYTIITLIVGAIVLGLPIFDTSFAIVRRLLNNQSITTGGDRGHLHHRLVDKGISHKKSCINHVCCQWFLWDSRNIICPKGLFPSIFNYCHYTRGMAWRYLVYKL